MSDEQSRRSYNIGMGRPRTIQRRVHPLVVKLQAARIASGMSQEVLAKKLGYHVDSIKRWELGRYPPTLNHLVDWCQALGYELILREAGKRALAEVIPYPDKLKLMAGR